MDVAKSRKKELNWFYWGPVYNNFNRVMERVELFLQTQPIGIFGYTADVVRARIAQRLVELMLFPYTIECTDRHKACQAPFQYPGNLIRLEYLTLDTEKGTISIKLMGVVRHLAEFLLHWIHVLIHILIPISTYPDSRRSSSTVLFGVGTESLFYDGSDKRFAKFCKEGPIDSLREIKKLVVQCTNRKIQPIGTEIEYRRFPLQTLLRTSTLGLMKRFHLLYLHISILLHFTVAVTRKPLLAIIARDIAYIPMVQTLDKHGVLKSVVTTNSSYSSQPLWMRNSQCRNFCTQMVWYSQNIRPIVYKIDQLQSNIPNYRHMVVDVHWLWSHEHASYLHELSVPGIMRVCGPVLWYQPEFDRTRISKPSDITVAIFDITPIPDQVAERIGLPGNYYNPQNMAMFIKDIVEVTKHIEKTEGYLVRLLLKHKRSYNANHDRSYIELVNRLTGENGPISLVPYDVNMYTLQTQSDFAVVIPYSSPALVANTVGITAIFYDPTETIEPTYEKETNIEFAAGRSSLQRLFQQQVVKYIKRNRIEKPCASAVNT